MEDGEDKVDDDADFNEAEHAEEESTDDDEWKKLRGEVSDWDQGHAGFEWSVIDFILDSVASFVSGDAEGGKAGTVEILRTEGKTFIDWIVMVSEVTADFYDFNVVYAGTAHNGTGGFGSCNASARLHFGPVIIGA